MLPILTEMIWLEPNYLELWICAKMFYSLVTGNRVRLIITSQWQWWGTVESGRNHEHILSPSDRSSVFIEILPKPPRLFPQPSDMGWIYGRKPATWWLPPWWGHKPLLGRLVTIRYGIPLLEPEVLRSWRSSHLWGVYHLLLVNLLSHHTWSFLAILNLFNDVITAQYFSKNLSIISCRGQDHTTCFPSSQGVGTVVMKNWLP